METFAQFGSIFLLFGHGLTYSTFMNTGRQSSNVYAPQVCASLSPQSSRRIQGTCLWRLNAPPSSPLRLPPGSLHLGL